LVQTKGVHPVVPAAAEPWAAVARSAAEAGQACQVVDQGLAVVLDREAPADLPVLADVEVAAEQDRATLAHQAASAARAGSAVPVRVVVVGRADPVGQAA
jgi:hypothetical protein